MELKELIAGIATYVAGDRAKAKEVVDELRATEGTKPVAQQLVDIGQGGKAGELQPKLTKLENDLKEARETIAAKDASIEDLKNSKAPDRKAIEQELRTEFQKKLDGEKKLREEAQANSKALRKKVAVDAFVGLLMKPDDQGVSVEEGWARQVVAREFDDRFDEAEDGTQRVLQIGSTLPYDGKHEEQIAALAKEARKKVATTYLRTSTDRGSGLSGGGTGGSGGNYDPVKAGTEMGKVEKADTSVGEKSLAFK
jgi:hypothetical protein